MLFPHRVVDPETSSSEVRFVAQLRQQLQLLHFGLGPLLTVETEQQVIRVGTLSTAMTLRHAPCSTLLLQHWVTADTYLYSFFWLRYFFLMFVSSLASLWFSLLYSFIFESRIISSATSTCGTRNTYSTHNIRRYSIVKQLVREKHNYLFQCIDISLNTSCKCTYYCRFVWVCCSHKSSADVNHSKDLSVKTKGFTGTV